MEHTFSSTNLSDLLGVQLKFEDLGFRMGDDSVGDYSDSGISFFNEDVYQLLVSCELDNLKTIFKDQIVVDLGSSCTPYGYLTALKSEAKAYIAVDNSPRAFFISPAITSQVKKLSLHSQTIPYAFVNKEMLSFLNASIEAGEKYSFICSSYGNYPDDTSLFSINFFDKLRELLPRAVHPNGGILQYATDLQLENFNKLPSKDVLKYDYSFLSSY